MRVASFLLLLSSKIGLAAAPALTYSTYLQSTLSPNAIATDASGNIYLAGTSVIKLKPNATDYAWTAALTGPTAKAIAVDAAGNVYIAGFYRTVQNTSSSFVSKLDPDGKTIFSTPLGGPAESVAQAIAVTPAGQILVTGTSYSAGFPSTPGAYSVPDTRQRPYLLELDPSGARVIFSATGIGGSAIALDPSGNIFVAGTTTQLDYPTTPGVYQPVFPSIIGCTGFLCQIGAQIEIQYVSRIDPTGSKLLYSTALSGTGRTANTGLAIDAAGNAYVTGYAAEGYPYTVTPPSVDLPRFTWNFRGRPFLSKLDTAGQQLLFSLPVGGAGVQIDSAGNLYVGGSVGSNAGAGYAVGSNLPVLANIPSDCLPSATAIEDVSYVSQVDSSSGNILNSRFLGGATLSLSAVALSGSQLWISGTTADLLVPFTEGALTPSPLTLAAGAGTYLAAVDFSPAIEAPGAPQVACVLDSGDLMPVGLAARNQLLSIFGTDLAPGTRVTAGLPAPLLSVTAELLYASSTQVNFAVPVLPAAVSSASLTLSTSAGAATPRTFPLIAANPALMMNQTLTQDGASQSLGFIALALNADGSVNSSTNPAQPGSAISVFVNGAGSDPVQFSASGWPVIQAQQPNPFLWEVTLQAPTNVNPPYNFSCSLGEKPLCLVQLPLKSGPSPVRAGNSPSASIYMTR